MNVTLWLGAMNVTLWLGAMNVTLWLGLGGAILFNPYVCIDLLKVCYLCPQRRCPVRVLTFSAIFFHYIAHGRFKFKFRKY